MTINRHDLIAAGLVAFLAIIVSVALAGCGVEIRAPQITADATNPLRAEVEKLTAENATATAERDGAIKTSADARKAAQDARAEAAAARALADEYDGKAKAYEATATDLRQAEIAVRIALVSWILAGVGLLSALLGGFLLIRFPSKTSLAVALSGVGALGVGLVGVWMAPHWIAAAWGVAVVVVLGLVVGVVYLLHDHQQALRQVWERSEAEITADPRLRRLLAKSGVLVTP